MKGLQFVDRKEEIEIIRNFFSETSERGLLASVIGIEGIGKSTLFKMMKDEFNDESTTSLCFMGNILSVDTPATFFNRFFSNLETKIHPTKHKFTEFFKKYADIISLTANIASSVSGIPGGLDLNKIMSSGKRSDALSTLETHFISMVQNFTERFPDQKLIFLIDDIDRTSHMNDFISFFEDVKNSLPPNAMIVVSSTENVMDADQILGLTKFDETNVHEFAKRNLPDVTEEGVKQVISKSGGYPLALHWLWQNYRKGVDINSLLLRLSREGFLQQLQENFLSKLDDDEIKILKICSALDIIDSRVISKVSELEQQLVNEILDDFLLSSVLIQLNYQQLSNQQMVDIYILDDTFRHLVESSFGKNIGTHNKLLQYFVDSLSENMYPVRNSTVGKIVTQLDAISRISNPPITPPQALFNLQMDVYKKFNLASEIIAYHWFSENTEEIKKYAQIQHDLAQTIEDPNYRKLYTKQAELNKLTADKKYAEAKKLCDDTASWLGSLMSHATDEKQKSDLTIAINYLRSVGSLMTSNGKSNETIFRKMLGKETSDKIMSSMENKIFKCIFLLQMLEETLTANNYNVAVELGVACLEQLKSVTEEDFKEFEKLNGAKIPSDQFEMIHSAIHYDLGTAYFFVAYQKMEKEEFDKKEVKELVEKSVEHLDVLKSDPVRGQLYHAAKELLSQIK